MELPRNINKELVLNADWDECPAEVFEEVKLLWLDNEYPEHHMTHFSIYDDGKNYPIISKYLKSQNIEDCIIEMGREVPKTYPIRLFP